MVKFEDSKIASVNKIVLMTNFRTMFPETISTLNLINDYVENLGLKLLLLSNTISSELKCTTVKIPFSMKEFSSLKEEEFNFPFNQNLISIDAEFNEDENPDVELYKAGLKKCFSAAHKIALTVKPAIALLWSATVPQSIIFKNVFTEYFIPTYFVERGLLPETLIFDESGNGACSSIKKKIDLGFVPQNFEHIYEEIKAYYFTNKIDKHEQPDYLSSSDFLEQQNLAGKKIITFLGQWDVASGVNSTNDYQSFLNSPHFTNTEEAFKSIVKFISDNENIALVFKPHPFDSKTYNKENNTRIIVDKKLNVRTLIESADVVIVMSTTIQYEVLFYDKPIVLLANSFLNGLNVGYEIKNSEEIGSAILQALNKKDYADKQINAEKFITLISSQILVSLNKKNPITTSLASFISHLSKKYFSNNIESVSKDLFDEIYHKTKNIFNEYLIKQQVQELILKAEELITGQNILEAKIILNDILQNLDPESIEVLNDLAVVELISGNFDTAQNLLNQILVKDPFNLVAKENINYISQVNLINTEKV